MKHLAGQLARCFFIPTVGNAPRQSRELYTKLKILVVKVLGHGDG